LLRVGAEAIAVIGEKDEDGLPIKIHASEGRAESSDVPVEVLHHRVIPAQIVPEAVANPRDFRDVRAELDRSGIAVAVELWRGDVRVVRRLDREDRKERLVILAASFEVVDQEIGERIGFVALEAESILGAGSVNFGVVLGVPIFVTEPVVESAPLAGGNPDHLVASPEVPLSEVSRVITRIAERGRDGRSFRVEFAGRAGDSILVRVLAGQE